MTVMEGRPAPDSEVFAKERAKLYNALIASITRVCAGEEVSLQSCIYEEAPNCCKRTIDVACSLAVIQQLILERTVDRYRSSL